MKNHPLNLPIARARAELVGAVLDLELGEEVSAECEHALAEVSSAIWRRRANERLETRNRANSPW